MIGYKIKNTVTEEGTVSRGVCEVNSDSYLVDIVETTKIGIENGEICYTEDDGTHKLDPETIVSMNLWGFTPSYIDECVNRFGEFLSENLSKNPEKCEFYMPTVVSYVLKDGKADVKVLESVDKWYGVTYKEDKPAVVNAFKEFKEKGIYPKNF